ncbi:hypothetical protein C2S52_017435 [Perilla frutescens var. hirtella]|nr:hypothetical protein C2S52_017435 [Perilla frutescens var. hirtella]
MVPTKAIHPEKQRRGGGALKEGGRILATTFLSLLMPLSFLLLARLSAARYFLSAINDHETSFFMSVFLHWKATLILSLLVSAVAIEALVQGINGNKPAFVVCERRRLCVAWVLIFLVQVCLSLGIHSTVDAEIGSFTVGNLVSPRRVAFLLGLHEIMLFWRRSVVAPVVDETMFGFSSKDFSWVEEVVLAAAFGNLWWTRLRDEAEALVALLWVRAELKMGVEAEDAVGWLLYCLTAAIGGVRVIKGFLWVAMRIFEQRHWPKKKGVVDGDAAVNNPV